MSIEITAARMTLAEARDLTDEVKADAAALWAKLLRLYRGGAHIALGYSSWGEYYAEEFGQTPRTGYRLLEAARVVDVLSDTHVTEAPAQNVVRELAPVLREEGAAAVAEAWAETVQEHGEQPTAAQTRATVEKRRPRPEPPPEPSPSPRPSARAFFNHLSAAVGELGAAYGAGLSPEERESYRPGIDVLGRVRDDLARFVDQAVKP